MHQILFLGVNIRSRSTLKNFLNESSIENTLPSLYEHIYKRKDFNDQKDKSKNGFLRRNLVKIRPCSVIVFVSLPSL